MKLNTSGSVQNPDQPGSSLGNEPSQHQALHPGGTGNGEHHGPTVAQGDVFVRCVGGVGWDVDSSGVVLRTMWPAAMPFFSSTSCQFLRSVLMTRAPCLECRGDSLCQGSLPHPTNATPGSALIKYSERNSSGLRSGGKSETGPRFPQASLSQVTQVGGT